MNNKKKPFSKILNEYRFFPRLFSILFIILLWQACYWFMGLENPTNAQAGFVSTIVATAAAFFKFYVNSGNEIKMEEMEMEQSKNKHSE